MAAIVSPSAARAASRSPPASTSPSQASAICAARYVLHETVASSPACVSTVAVASRASGLSAVFVRPIVTTPRPRTVSSSRTISALRPDCETSTSSVPAVSSPRW